MHRSCIARRAAVAALLAASTLAIGAEPARIHTTWSGGPRTASAPTVVSSQAQTRPQPQRNDYYDNRSTQNSDGRTYGNNTPPPNVQVQPKPNYPFTEVAPRSLW
jgi:hypothetical protein